MIKLNIQANLYPDETVQRIAERAALQTYNAACAQAQPSRNPVLHISGRQLAPDCHNAPQLALLAMLGNPVSFVRDSITTAEVESMQAQCINGLLIQSRGILVENSCGECRLHGLRPFPDCRRVESHFGNSCGNCEWRDHGNRCVRSDRSHSSPASRRRNPLPLPSRESPNRSLTPPPHASPDRSPTPPPSADHKSSGRRETLLLHGASEDQPLIVD
ncbi:uncharacterized protein Bfra_002170 [Botrytis fragariae]|uniref:Uncharacterized protein n=1 Tax=Botrytis fragariae TaxID=1964551 RepID=A0A8H6EML5_9HELO|nr:uncharacterized protein Bfra_002170 [Botrytis fragariae]KAF5877802.1 hypothetical protein Bfra_002170 [Botrytis fragariae]